MKPSAIILLGLMAGILFPRPLWGQEAKTPIQIKHADHVEILDQEQKVILSGNVHILQEGLEIRAQQIEYDMARQKIEAQGNVTIREGSLFIESDRVTYDVAGQGGVFEQVFVESPPWKITAPLVEKRGTEELIFKSGRFSTCDLENPHYKIRAAKVRIMTDRKIIAWHVFFYIGPVPVLYLPFFYRSLKDWRPPFKIEIGETSFLGRYVKTEFNYFFSGKADESVSDEISLFGASLDPSHYGSIYLDEFQHKGWGAGFKHNFDLVPKKKIGPFKLSAPYNMSGSIYFYRVKKILTDRQKARWASSLAVIGRIPMPGGPIRLTANSNLVSDESFVRKYAVVSRSRGSHGDRRIDFSLDKRFGFASIGLRTKRIDRFLPKEGDRDERFIKDKITLPDVEGRISSIRFGKLPLHFTASGNWTREQTAHHLDLSGKLISGPNKLEPSQTLYPAHLRGSYRANLTNTFSPIKRRWTLNQSLGTSYDWVQPRPTEPIDKPRLLKQASYRAGTTIYPLGGRRFTLQYNRNLAWRLNRKEEVGRHGFQSDRSSGSLQFSTKLKSLTFRTRTNTSFDHLRVPVLSETSDPLLVSGKLYTRLGTLVERKFGFLSQTLNLGLPRRDLTFNTNFRYSIAARDLSQVNGGITMTGKKLWRTRLDYTFINRRVTTDGMLATAADNHFVFGFDITVPIFSVFRFTAIEKFDFSTGKFSSRRYRLYRDLHCWAALVSWDVLEDGETRLSFSVNLKALPQRSFRYRKDRFEQYRTFQGQEYIEQLERDLNL